MEPVFVLIVVFASILMLTKMNLDFKRNKLVSGAGDGSLKQSEIKQLIQDAVDEAIRPVLDKLDEQQKQISVSNQRLLEEPENAPEN